MGSVPTDCKYTKDHEWLRQEGDHFVIGITDYAQHALGDVVFVELPGVGSEVKKGSSFATVESVKAASDVYAPVDGRIAEVNSALSDKPELLNSDPHGAGWMIKISAPSAQLGELMDAAAYEAYIAELSK